MATKQSHALTAPTSLSGATVIVTRPSASAASLKRRIAALGGAVVSLPGVGVGAVNDVAAARAALRAAVRADAAIFVSPSAVRYAYALSPGLRFARATQVCSVGRATALALARRGVRNIVHPHDRQDSEGLLALPQLTSIRGRQIALIGAPGGRDLLSSTLRARGATLRSVHVYKRVAPRWNRRHFAALDGAAAPLLILLSSAEALANIACGLSPPLFAKLAAGECVVSSLRLARAAREAGFARVHVAASAVADDMLTAAANALAQHRL
jgi:uroporphyrinogen-III synthase